MSTHDNSFHHIIPLKIYLAVAGALLVLTAVTVGVSFIDLGGWNAVVAVFVAAIKATLVALFFMHLKYDKKINLIVFLTAILFLTIMLTFTFFDIISRDDIYTEVGKPINDKAAMYDQLKSDTTAVHHESDSIPVIADDSL
jgi:cytochrome c oxidase subunit 4